MPNVAAQRCHVAHLRAADQRAGLEQAGRVLINERVLDQPCQGYGRTDQHPFTTQVDAAHFLDLR